MISAIQQKKSYQWIYHFTAYTNIFAVLTLFGPVFPLFCDSLRMSKSKIGLILSILPLLYVVSLFLSKWIMRHGPRNVFLNSYLVRYGILLFLPLAAFLSVRFGDMVVFVWVALGVFLFGIFRAIGDTAWMIWVYELISAKVRGKVDAISTIVGMVGQAGASIAAMLIIKKLTGLAGFQTVMYVGILFGFVAMACAGRLPGGGPQAAERESSRIIASVLETLRNLKFRWFLAGNILIVIIAAGFSFLPLYLNERIGFSADKIMFFSLCFQVGVLVSAFLWGWCADRFGSKPVVASALVVWPLLPFLFFLLPRLELQSMARTGLVYAVFGILWQGYFAGANRYFYVDVLPSVRSPAFATSLNVAVQSIVSAFFLFFYGWLLDVLQPLKYDWHFIHVDNFTAYFVVMLLCSLGAIYLFGRTPAVGSVRPGQFMSFFFEGNPLLAFSSIFRYHFADDEFGRMELTRRMGDAKSHFTVEELRQAVGDPSFNVRYEAVVSMARMPPDDKLIEALSDVVRSREPGISEAAVWALGRIGDGRAVPVLREMLKCEYALLRSQCARSLAKLNDQDSASEIIAALQNERNDNIRAGYAAALGRLRLKEMLPDLLVLLRRLVDDHLCGEVALAVARIVGAEHHFIDLWRRSRSDFETTCAEALLVMGKKLAQRGLDGGACGETVRRCVQYFEQRNVASAAQDLRAIIAFLPLDSIEPPVVSILKDCDTQMEKYGGLRQDYILLALCGIHIAIISMIHGRRKKDFISDGTEASIVLN